MAENSDRPPRAQSRPGVPDFVEEIDTGVLEPAARAEARRGKTPSERIERLEARTDAVTVSLVRLETKTDGQTALIENIQKSVDRIATRDDIVFTSKVEVHKAAAIAAVEDESDRKKQRRERITLAIKGLVGGGALIELLHRFIL